MTYVNIKKKIDKTYFHGWRLHCFFMQIFLKGTWAAISMYVHFLKVNSKYPVQTMDI